LFVRTEKNPPSPVRRENGKTLEKRKRKGKGDPTPSKQQGRRGEGGQLFPSLF